MSNQKRHAQSGRQHRREFLKGSTAVALIAGVGGLCSEASHADTNKVPVWTNIPDQNWAVGVPVYVDLRTYCSDPDDDQLEFAINAPLPAGVSLDGSIISGTPTGEMPAQYFVAMVDDGMVRPEKINNMLAI